MSKFQIKLCFIFIFGLSSAVNAGTVSSGGGTNEPSLQPDQSFTYTCRLRIDRIMSDSIRRESTVEAEAILKHEAGKTFNGKIDLGRLNWKKKSRGRDSSQPLENGHTEHVVSLSFEKAPKGRSLVTVLKVHATQKSLSGSSTLTSYGESRLEFTNQDELKVLANVEERPDWSDDKPPRIGMSFTKVEARCKRIQ